MKELSEKLRAAEVLMHQQLRQARPIKDAANPGETDRTVVMNGLAAEAIADYNHLLRLWEYEMAQVNR